MFEALAAGSVEAAEAKAGEARCDLSRPHVFLHVVRAPSPADDDRPPGRRSRPQFESRLRRLYPRAFFDSRHDRVRAIAPLPTARRGGGGAAAAGLRGAGREAGVVVGLSDVDRGAASARRRMREAADAARIGRSLVADGGAVVLRGSSAPTSTWSTSSSTTRRTTATASSVEELIEYDRRRGARLVETLERFLGRSRQRRGQRAGALHPSEHGASAARADRARGRARPRQGGPALARAGAQAGPLCTTSAPPQAASHSRGR